MGNVNLFWNEESRAPRPGRKPYQRALHLFDRVKEEEKAVHIEDEMHVMGKRRGCTYTPLAVPHETSNVGLPGDARSLQVLCKQAELPGKGYGLKILAGIERGLPS
jgi:hypothetical protein